MIGTQIVAIGDIHGNIHALESAFEKASSAGFDHLVLMGDLLTYGVHTREVIAKVHKICSADNVTVLRGNHDTFYPEEKNTSINSYIAALPPWVKESIEFTRRTPGIEAFTKLKFVNCYRLSGVFFAHANPFGQGNWRYLNSTDDYREAASSLRAQEFSMGVFAHTHRCRAFEMREQENVEHDFSKKLFCESNKGTTWVINTGSVGQPRDAAKIVYIVALTLERRGVHVRFLPLDYDRNAHLRSIKNAALSAATKEKLIAFFN